jgi:hypothetical protein
MFSIKPIEAETSGNTTLRANGTGCRAAALPCKKVLTWFEGAHFFREVSILENPDDSFEDAHPFPRCSPELLASIINKHAYVSKNGIEAEARRCATLRENGTGSRAVPRGLDRSDCRNEAY